MLSHLTNWAILLDVLLQSPSSLTDWRTDSWFPKTPSNLRSDQMRDPTWNPSSQSQTFFQPFLSNSTSWSSALFWTQSACPSISLNCPFVKIEHVWAGGGCRQVVSTFVIQIYHRWNSSQICSFQQHFAENSFPGTKQFKDLKLAKTSKF